MSQEINIALPSQAFDVTFHPTEPLVFAGLLTGEVRWATAEAMPG